MKIGAQKKNSRCTLAKMPLLFTSNVVKQTNKKKLFTGKQNLRNKTIKVNRKVRKKGNKQQNTNLEIKKKVNVRTASSTRKLMNDKTTEQRKSCV